MAFNPEEFQLAAGGKDKVLKFFDMDNISFQGHSNMTPSEIKGLKYNAQGDKVYALGQKFVRVFLCLDPGFKSVENIEVPMTL